MLALKWEDIDLAGGQMQIRRTINRLAKYEDAADGNRTEIVLDTPKTRMPSGSVPLTRGMIDELRRWRSVSWRIRRPQGPATKTTALS